MPSITDNWRAFLVSDLLDDYSDAAMLTMSDLEHRYYSKINGLIYPPMLSIADLKYASFTAGIDDAQDGLELLSQAEGFWDARYYSGSGSWTNSGYAIGLDLQLGSTSGADTNDPTWLSFNGDPYVYMPGQFNSAIRYPILASQLPRGDLDIQVRVMYPTASTHNFNHFIATPGFDWASRGFDCIVNLVVSGGNNILQFPALANMTQPEWFRLTRKISTGEVKMFRSMDGQTWTQWGSTVIGPTVQVDIADGYIYASHDTQPPIGRVYYNSLNGQIVFDAKLSGQSGYGGWEIVRVSGDNALKPVLVQRPCWLFGVDDGMTSSNQAVFDIGANQPFTLILARRKWGPHNNYHILVSKRDFGTSNPGYDVVGQIGNFNVYGEGFSNPSYSGDIVLSPEGKLSTVGMSRDAVGLLSTLVDGKVYPAQTQNGSLSNTASFTIASPPNYSVPADMEVYGMAWFRRALTSQEVQQVSAYFGAS